MCPVTYTERTYRNRIAHESFVTFQVRDKETDLLISADLNCREDALKAVRTSRGYVERYISYNPDFLTSLEPIQYDPHAPEFIRNMMQASGIAGVGPMATVAGAIAEYVGSELLRISGNVIVENGGDIFIKVERDIRVGIFAGKSPLSYRLALKVRAEDTPLGICTSSGTVGHSLSFGIADAVCVISASTALADAAATYLGNCVRRAGDIKAVLSSGMNIKGVRGIVIIVGKVMGAIGAVELEQA